MKSGKMLAVLIMALGLMVSFGQISRAEPMGSALTYQGRLMDKNRPAEGLYDFQFRLYDSNDPCTGTELASPIDINDLDVIDGHFIVDLDFGSGIFDGNAVWLETRVVRSPMGSDPATLSPLIELTPTPYALYAQTTPAGHSLDAADGSPADALYIDNEGNIGIGTTNPQSKLSVGGDGIADIGVYGAGSYAGVYGRDSDTGAYGYFGYNTVGVYGGGSNFGVYGGGSEYGVYGYGPGTGVHGLDMISGSYGHIGYDTWGGYFSGDGYFSGNVGIGTVSPSAKLDVNGDINISTAYKIAGDTVLLVTRTNNTQVGIGAGINNTAHYGTFVGYNAGYNNQGDGGPWAGNYNTFVGNYAGYSNTWGYCNTFVGSYAGTNNTEGTYNTFLGDEAGFFNSTGWRNTFLGYNTGNNNTTGWSNTFLGSFAGQSNITGYSNTFLGDVTGNDNLTGNNNTFVGAAAGNSNTEGSYNTFVGRSAGRNNSTGSGNVFIGYRAGNNEGGSGKLYIANGPDDSNTLIYGDFYVGRVGIGTTSPGAELEVNGEILISPDSGSVLKVGRHSSSSPNAYIDTENASQMRLQVNGSTKMAIDTTGNVGIGTTSPASRLHVVGGCITGSMCSDIRLKKNIEPLPLDDPVLDRIMGLQAVTFEWKHRDDGKRQIGLIAQDVEEVFPEVVTTPDNESCEKGLLATGLDAVLVEAIKELRAENELLKERLEDLERIIQFNVVKKVQ